MNGQEVNLPIANEAVHDPIDPKDSEARIPGKCLLGGALSARPCLGDRL